MNILPSLLLLLCAGPISVQASSPKTQEPESSWRHLPSKGHREPRMGAFEGKDHETLSKGPLTKGIERGESLKICRIFKYLLDVTKMLSTL